MSLYVAAYDVSDDEHRQQVAKILRQFGRRVQRSVFEVDLAPEDLGDLKRQIGLWLGEHDAFDLFPVDNRDPTRRICWFHPPAPEDPVMVV